MVEDSLEEENFGLILYEAENQDDRLEMDWGLEEWGLRMNMEDEIRFGDQISRP